MNKFISVRGRFLTNVEALNMVESVGNYTKHRKVPVLHPKTYTTFFVPAISGESVAHRYQEILVDEALNQNLNVCSLCSKKVFLKNTNKDVIKANFNEDINLNNPHETEKKIIENCVVEDIGGFLLAEASNVKRTSNFYTGYMIPVREVIEQAVIDPQLHMRYALGTGFVGRQRGSSRQASGQMIYYVELASAVYTFSFDLDTRYIGSTTFEKMEDLPDKEKRQKLALTSLEKFLLELDFGAKRTRFLPVIRPESMVVAVSENETWTVPSSFSINYITEAMKKLEKFPDDVKLYVYIAEELLESPETYAKKTSEELIESIYNTLDLVVNKLSEKGDEKLIDIEAVKKRVFEELMINKANEMIRNIEENYSSEIISKYDRIVKELENNGSVELYQNYSEFVSQIFSNLK